VSIFKPSATTYAITNVIVVGETEKAIDARWGDDTHIAHWIAKSQLLPGTEVQHQGDRGAVVIPRWLALKARILPAAEVRTNG
jgi:hypothetical protein